MNEKKTKRIIRFGPRFGPFIHVRQTLRSWKMATWTLKTCFFLHITGISQWLTKENRPICDGCLPASPLVQGATVSGRNPIPNHWDGAKTLWILASTTTYQLVVIAGFLGCHQHIPDPSKELRSSIFVGRFMVGLILEIHRKPWGVYEIYLFLVAVVPVSTPVWWRKSNKDWKNILILEDPI